MKIIRRKRYIFGLLFFFLFLTGVKITVFDNIDALFAIEAGLDNPSAGYFLVQERIYRLSNRENVTKKILQYLEEDQNKHLHDLYIKTLGVVGEQDVFMHLLRSYSKYQGKKEYSTNVWHIINAMGMIGNPGFTPLLKRLLENYSQHRVQVSRYLLARSLYLITGNQYKYINSEGRETKITLTDELINARKVIVDSENRKRTFEEMLTLDKLFRPPDDWSAR